MNDLILKRLAVLNLSLSLMAIVPKISFAQAIYGLDKASHFNTTHHGPFSIYAGAFRSEHSANQLRDKIAARIHYPVRVIATGQLHAVVIGPLPSPQVVRAAGNSLTSTVALKPNKLNRIARVSHEQPKQNITSSPSRATPPKVSLLPPANSLANGISATVLIGGSSYTLDKQQQVFFPAETFRTDSFEVDGNKINFASAIGIAYEKILESDKNKPWNILQSISLGVNAYYNESSRNGSVYEYSLPDFNNATYDMKVKSYRVMLDTEWVLHSLSFGVMPFVEAGIGGAQNTLRFQNIPRPNIGADGGYYNLSNHASTHFAYELGAGLKIPVNNHFIASARYLFVDTGKAESGISDNGTGVLLASPLKTKVQSQSVLFGLSYLFG
ncbi:SPOR domain-containing protein [Legionella maioricensis]|uniref:SPOR domain-containing protein n=1 Tax=Legionella maioricensis TaxID=2896528 RepID=A0A9X2ICL9_9GAMM|nr:SPOR domain-containing protein [Legionella maioricensis]MCL9685356.1 SPOR domain-containing protein [Legionella maioricensis]MCL9688682.1 SPOR domain-containing protein [Legionella maioricensis]